MKINGRYNWIGQADRLIYLGEMEDGSGFWHQFAKVDAPTVVWCEVRTKDLHRLEETPDDPTEKFEPVATCNPWLMQLVNHLHLPPLGGSANLPLVLHSNEFVKTTGVPESVSARTEDGTQVGTVTGFFTKDGDLWGTVNTPTKPKSVLVKYLTAHRGEQTQRTIVSIKGVTCSF